MRTLAKLFATYLALLYLLIPAALLLWGGSPPHPDCELAGLASFLGAAWLTVRDRSPRALPRLR